MDESPGVRAAASGPVSEGSCAHGAAVACGRAAGAEVVGNGYWGDETAMKPLSVDGGVEHG
jgi:hypothetical protein